MADVGVRELKQRLSEYLELTGARTLDALHLAAAQRLGGAAVPFVTFDVRRARAARMLGLTVLPA